MSKFLVTTTEVYRVQTETEVTNMIEEAKQNKLFELAKYSCVKKEVKQKGEVVDEYFQLTMTKSFNNIKEPSRYIEVGYEDGGYDL